MKPYYEQDGITINHRDCRDVLPTEERGSVTLLWTDPPYGHGNHDNDLNDVRTDMAQTACDAAAPDMPLVVRRRCAGEPARMV